MILDLTDADKLLLIRLVPYRFSGSYLDFGDSLQLRKCLILDQSPSTGTLLISLSFSLLDWQRLIVVLDFGKIELEAQLRSLSILDRGLYNAT